MAEDQDNSQKTEEPTRRRLEEALKHGQVVSSREVTNFFMLMLLTAVLLWIAPFMGHEMKVLFQRFIETPETYAIDEGSFRILTAQIFLGIGIILGIPLGLALIIAIVANIIQHPFFMATDHIEPKLERISPISGLKRLFSMRSLVEFIKGVLKISVVAAICAYAVWPKLPQFRNLMQLEIPGIVAFTADLAERMMIGVIIFMFFVAAADYLYQRYEFMKSMRMSKQELKDEYKQQEGDPIIKQRLRSLRMERARKRMMASVPKADVVITNPTHFAAALQYEPGVMRAPKLVAKGADLIAHNIRKVAEEHKVPIVRNPPLARVLFDTCEIDEEVPVEHYKAVAEIISYVFKLKGKKLAPHTK